MISYTFHVLVYCHLYLLFHQTHTLYLVLVVVFFGMQVCFLNSLPNGDYWNNLIGALFSNNPFSGKTSLSVKNSYLSTFSDDSANILAVVCLNCNELCFARCCYQLFWFSHSFCNRFFLNLNELFDGKVVSFTRNEYGSLV